MRAGDLGALSIAVDEEDLIAGPASGVVEDAVVPALLIWSPESGEVVVILSGIVGAEVFITALDDA